MMDARAEDFACHCDAPIGQPCVTAGDLAGCCHATRHKLADAENWRRLATEMRIETGWTIGRPSQRAMVLESLRLKG